MAWPNIYGLDSQHFNRQPPAKPTLLIVHDAFHTPEHYDKLVDQLTESGYRTLIPQLPSSGRTIECNALEADVRTLIECGKTVIDARHNLIVIAHGYGSIPAAIAAERLNIYSLDRPRAGSVSRLIVIAGVLLKPDENYLDVVEPDWASTKNGVIRPKKPESVFYQDCSREAKSNSMCLLRSQNESSLRSTVSSPGWTRIPTLYVVCTQDNCISASLQRNFAKELGRINRQSAVTTLDTGHCPFMTIPKEVAGMVDRVSG